MAEESEIDLFDFSKTPSKKRKIETCFYQNIECDTLTNAVNPEQLTFSIPAQGEGLFIDVSQTKLYLKLQLVRGDGELIVDIVESDGSTVKTDKKKRVTTIQNSGPSLLDNIFFKIRHMHLKSVKYASLISYVRRLITPDQDKLDGLAGFFPLDQSGKFDSENNTALSKRYIFGNTKQEFVFHIDHPLFLQPRAVPAHFPCELICDLKKPEYYLQSFQSDLPNGYFGYKILSAQLQLRYLTLEPSFEKSLVSKMKNNTLYYDINEVECYDITLNSSIQEFNKNIFTNDTLPESCLFFLISHDNHIGTYSKSPFNFEKHGLKSIGVHVNGKLVHGCELDTSNDTEIYDNLNLLPDIAKSKLGSLSKSDISKGYCILPFVLKHPMDSDSDPLTGNLSVSLKFNSVPATNLHLICMAFRNTTFSLKSDGNFFYE